MSGFEGFDAYCEEHNIQPGEEPAAFVAYLTQETGWDGKMEEVVEMPRPEVTHMCPAKGSNIMSCCGLSPFERMSDRITLDPDLVTCLADRPRGMGAWFAGQYRAANDLVDRARGSI